MGLFEKIRSLFTRKKEIKSTKQETLEEKTPEIELKEDKEEPKLEKQPQSIHNHTHNGDESQDEMLVVDLWEYIDPIKNTQAYHIISVIGFDEWVDMPTIKDRIKQTFFIEYKNEKSLYPYIKTLVDIGLLETNSVGGKRQWKKREILISVKKEKAMLTTKVKSGLKITK